MLRILCFMLSFILLADMLVLSYCNLFLAVQVFVKIVIVRLNISFFSFWVDCLLKLLLCVQGV